MIDVRQAKSISKEAGRFRKIPRKFERKIETQIRNAAKDGLDHVCVMLFDIDGDMAAGIVDFLTGNGYGVVYRYMQDNRDRSEMHQFMISWRYVKQEASKERYQMPFVLNFHGKELPVDDWLDHFGKYLDDIEQGKVSLKDFYTALRESHNAEKAKTTWTSVDDRLPDKTGWYLVYAPEYHGSKYKEFHNGYGFAKFTISKKGEPWWSIDDHHSKEYIELEKKWRKNYFGEENPVVLLRKHVKLWMPLQPIPRGLV